MQRALGTNYLVEIAYVGTQGRQMMIKTDSNQAPPTLGVNNSNTNRPFIAVAPKLQSVGTATSTGTLDYNGLLMKFQRRFANNFSFLNWYTYGQALDLSSDNDGGVTLTNIFDPQYNHGPADYDIKHTLRDELGVRAAVGEEQAVRRVADQRHRLLPDRPAADRDADAERPVHGHGQPAEPDLRRHAVDPTIDKWIDASCFTAPTDTTATYGNSGRGILRGPGQSNIDASLIKNTRFGHVNTEFRIEAFNIFNHPQFANPNTTLGNAAVRHHLGDAVQPVLLAVRHDRAQRAARVQGDVLEDAAERQKAGPARSGSGLFSLDCDGLAAWLKPRPTGTSVVRTYVGRGFSPGNSPTSYF